MRKSEPECCSLTVLNSESMTDEVKEHRTSQVHFILKKSPIASEKRIPNGSGWSECELTNEHELPLAPVSTEAMNSHSAGSNGFSSLQSQSSPDMAIPEENDDRSYKLPEEKMSPSLNGRVNGSFELKPLKSAVSISNGPIVSSVVVNNALNRKIDRKEDAAIKAPTNVMNKKYQKVKMLTVSKRVPLINMVGNHSKLIPFVMPSKSNSTSESMSILEARLTSSSSSNSTSLPLQSENDVSKLSSESPSSPKLLSLQQSGSEPKQVLKQVSPIVKDDESTESSHPVPVKKLKLLEKDAFRPKTVLSFERGLTRLVAVESRTVTMVDIGTQVFISGEKSHEGKNISVSCPSVPAVSSGVTQAPVKSSTVMSENQLLVLDTISGKKVLAIPRRILNSSVGSKTVSIGSNQCISSNQIQISKENILSCVSNVNSGSQIVSAVQLRNTSSSTNAGHLDLEKTHQEQCGDDFKSENKRVNNLNVIGMSSLSTDTISTASNRAPVIVPSPIDPSKCTPKSTLAALSIPISSSEKSHKVETDSLVLPLNSPFKFDGNVSFDGPSLPVTQTLIVSQSGDPQPSTSKTSKINPLVLPLNSSVQTILHGGVTQAFPTTSSYFILMPSGIVQKTKESNHLHHESAPLESLPSGMMDAIKRCSTASSSESPPAKRQCVETLETNKLVADQKMSKSEISIVQSLPVVGQDGLRVIPRAESSKPALEHPKYPRVESNSSTATLKSNTSGTPNEMTPEFVKSAFSDFKTCLVVNKAGKLPIHVAVENNDFAAVKRQCIVLKARRTNVDVPNSKDETPLQLALYCGHSSIVELLLKHGADATVCDPDGNTTLHLCVIHAEEALEALLSSGQLDEKIINVLNDEGFSALHLAAQFDKADAINLLIKYGAEVDLPDGKSGRTALYHAAERKHYRSQKALVNNGADMREPTFTGSTPFLITRSDAIAQITGGQLAVAEEIDSDTLLKPPRPKNAKGRAVRLQPPL